MKKTILISLFYSLITFTHAEQIYKFIENKGQWNEKVKFRTSLPSGYLYLLKNSVKFMFYKGFPSHHSSIPNKNNPTSRLSPSLVPDTNQIPIHSYEVIFKNAKKTPKIVPLHPLVEKNSYFYGNDAEKWVSGAGVFKKIVYKNIYDRIDLEYLEENENLKYQFVIMPKGKIKSILLSYKGCDIDILENGNLQITTSLGTIIEKKPVAYQWISGKKIIIPCKFVLKDEELSFQLLDSYDKSQSLVIDPELIFSTYSGSIEINWGNTATYDEFGNTYTAGIVRGTLHFPITTGAFQSEYIGRTDIGILKFSPDGSQLMYATYFGGSKLEVPSTIIINSKGHLIIMGSTSSDDLPMKPNSIYRNFQGGDAFFPLGGEFNPEENERDNGLFFDMGTDIFLAILNESGTELLGSTFLGGTKNDGLNQYPPLKIHYGDAFRSDIILDEQDNIYLVSMTESDNFPTTEGVLFPNQIGEQDVVLVKLSSTLDNLIWSTYFGSTGHDGGYCIKIDHSGNLIIGGGTTSSDFPTTPNTLHSSFQGGNSDGFISKISNDGRRIIKSTFLGTGSSDQVYLLDLNVDESIVVVGETSGTYPMTENVYSFGSRNFIHELDKEMEKTHYATRIGTRFPFDGFVLTAFLVDDCSKIYVAGWGDTSSNVRFGENLFTFPVTSDAIQSTTDGDDFYLLVLSEKAEKLMYATFMGANEPVNRTNIGDHVDGGTSRFDKSGIVYQAVCTCSQAPFPTTYFAYTPSNKNKAIHCSNAVFKLDLSQLKASFTHQANTPCAPSEIVFKSNGIGGKEFLWNFGDGSPMEKGKEIVHIFTKPGEYTVSLTAIDKISCIQESTFIKKISLRTPYLKTDFPKNIVLCEGDTKEINLTQTGAYSFEWKNAEGEIISTDSKVKISPLESTYYEVTLFEYDKKCSVTRRIDVEVISDLDLDYQVILEDNCLSKDMKIYIQNKTILDGFLWSIEDGAKNFPGMGYYHTFTQSGTYTLNIEASFGSCLKKETKQIDVQLVYPPNVFTPNNDGFNDIFLVGDEKTENWKIEVFDRWGNNIYSNSQHQNFWQAEGLKKGIYYYIIKSLSTDKSCKGWVHIIN